MRRRLKAAGLPGELSPHSFRVATVTDLLEQNVPLEEVQHLAGHADPRTTRLYDRRRRKVTRNIVERISIRASQVSRYARCVRFGRMVPTRGKRATLRSSSGVTESTKA